jgi:hypothetical protein
VDVPNLGPASLWATRSRPAAGSDLTFRVADPYGVQRDTFTGWPGCAASKTSRGAAFSRNDHVVDRVSQLTSSTVSSLSSEQRRVVEAT